MREEPFHGLDEALDRLLELDPEERMAFVRRLSRDDPSLSAELQRLLDANEGADAFLGAAGRAARHLLDRDSSDGGEAPPLPLPTHIGPYEVLDRLGAGGMGTVYLARQRGGGLDRQVALKVIGITGDASQFQRRFRAEQKILSRLEHPNVARLYEAGMDEVGAPYFVMELVDGIPIDRFADERQLSVPERLALVQQLADALSYAHRNLVVHRDVKPSNILVTADGTVKLLDFGVAKLLEAEPTSQEPLTGQGAPVLTPEYASPEQIRGEPVTTAADVYATGVLLYELLTGLRPYEFTSRSPVHIETVITNREPRRPSEAVLQGSPETGTLAEARASTPTALSRALTGDLDWIILKSLRKEPQARYGTVQQLADDLDRYLNDEPVLARPPTWRYRATKFARRNAGALAAAGLVLLSLVSGLGATWWQAQNATREAQRADRVKDLVVGLFEASDPDEAQGAELTAVELLARGESSLMEGLEDEPSVRAELLDIVGSIYTSLGEYDRAEPLLESSLSLREALGGEEEIVESLGSLADLRYGAGDLEEGERLARRQLDIRTRLDGTESVNYAVALSNVATFLSSRAEFDEAEAMLLEALEIDQRSGRKDLEAVDWNSLGILRARKGDYDGGIEAGERSVAARREHAPDENLDLATSFANLAWALDNKGEWERADSFYQATIDIRKRLLGPDHPHVAIAVNNLASMRQKEGRLEESRTLHEESLRIRRAVFGDDHFDVGASLNNLGIVSYYESDYAGAEATFRDVLRIFRLHRAEDHPNVLTAVNNLAATLREQGKLDESERLFRETLATRTEILGPDHSDTGGAWNNLGAILLLRGNASGAEAAHRTAVDIFRGAFTADHPDLANALMSHGKSLIDLERYDEAIEVLEEGCDSYEARFGADHARTAHCRGAHGLALSGAGRAQDARGRLESAVPILEAEQAGQPWTLRAREALDRLPGA